MGDGLPADCVKVNIGFSIPFKSVVFHALQDEKTPWGMYRWRIKIMEAKPISHCCNW